MSELQVIGHAPGSQPPRAGAPGGGGDGEGPGPSVTRGPSSRFRSDSLNSIGDEQDGEDMGSDSAMDTEGYVSFYIDIINYRYMAS